MRIISSIDDQQLVKKILKHLSLWDVKHKPPARAHGPPTEAFIIYDECSSPSADDPPSLLMLRRDKLPNPAESGVIRLKPTSKKTAPGKAVSYAQSGLK